MPDTSGLNPRQVAALDQFGARFRDMQQELCASLQRAGDAFAAMSRTLRDFGDEIQVTALQLAIEDGEAIEQPPELAELDQHLDLYWE